MGDERETKRNEKHAKSAECEAKTCNYACPGVCQNQREEVPASKRVRDISHGGSSSREGAPYLVEYIGFLSARVSRPVGRIHEDEAFGDGARIVIARGRTCSSHARVG
jgi:hypothetical protein